jgi:hypothetical protein
MSLALALKYARNLGGDDKVDLTKGMSDKLLEERFTLSDTMAPFVKAAWPILEPRRPLVWGWHIDCMLEHLQAAFVGEIRTLIFNVPPGHFKSSSVSVLYHAWTWTSRAEYKLLTGSYAMTLAMRDSTKARRLIESRWYRERWPEIRMQKDQNAKGYYVNTEGGARFCFSTDGTVTGEHGDTALLDDPLRAQDAQSPVKRQNAIDFITETLPSRLLAPEKAVTILIMQRLHERDPTGHMLAEAKQNNDKDVVHVCLPAHFDPNRRCTTMWYRDPRKERGELLWPQMFSERALHQRTKDMTERAKAAQYEQSPMVLGGSILKRAQWRIWPQRLPAFFRRIISFDPAMKDGDDTSYWACTIWGVFNPAESWDAGSHAPPKHLPNKPCAMLIGAWRQRKGYVAAKTRLLETISEFTIDDEPPDHVLIERKAAGLTLLEEFEEAEVKNVDHWPPRGKGTGREMGKVERAEHASDFFHSGRIWVPGKKLGDGTRSTTRFAMWVEEVVYECELFPGGETDDLVDTVTQAINFLRQNRDIGVDTDPDDEADEKLKPPPEPVEPIYG